MKRPIPFPPGAGTGGPGDPLDALLGRLPEPESPPDLAARTLQQVRAEVALDRLLERGLAVDTPPGLAQRLLSNLAPLRTSPSAALPAARRATAPDRDLDQQPSGRRTSVARGSRRNQVFALAAAAALLIALALVLRPWEQRSPRETDLAQAPVHRGAPALAGTKLVPQPDGNAIPNTDPLPDTPADPTSVGVAPDEEFLAVLDVLENWETLTDPALLALELEADAGWWDDLESLLEGSAAAEDRDEG
jgi:hypothetical protein